MPLFEKIDISKVDVNKPEESLKGINMAEIAVGLTTLKKEDFSYIQVECLKACSEILPGAKAPAIRADGTYGIIDIDTRLALALTVHALMFNVNDFFEGSPLGSILEGLSSSKQD